MMNFYVILINLYEIGYSGDGTPKIVAPSVVLENPFLEQNLKMEIEQDKLIN